MKNLRRWWQIRTGRYETPFDTDTPFWAISLIAHLVIILLLAKVVMPESQRRAIGELLSTATDESELIDELPDEIEIFEVETDDIGDQADEALEEQAAQTPTLEFVSDATAAPETELFEAGEIFAAEMESATATVAEPTLEVLKVRGTAGAALKKTSGAVDRLAEEIRLRMAEGDLMVVWLFDQSASVRSQREVIANQFNRVYEQIEGFHEITQKELDAAGGKAPLLTDLYQFGQTCTKLIPKPTFELDRLREGVAKVKRDDSGIENVMSAVIQIGSKYRGMTRVDRKTGRPERNVMIILVSDEAGDDLQRTDEAVRVCVNHSISVYTVGVPAPFGRPETVVKWVDPDPEYDQSPQPARVSQGPETPRPERLKLGFANGDDDLEQIDSGFGPYFLTRLCYETGGLYFAVHPNRKSRQYISWGAVENYAARLTYFFDPDVMRRYQPTYVSLASYNRDLSQSTARQALVRAAEFTQTGTLGSPQLRFPRLNEATFVNLVSEAQKDAAFVMPELEKLVAMLESGEKDRQKEQVPRWQAGYDLALGRALAARIRAESYNQMLALVKTKLQFDPAKDENTPRNNTWILRPSNTIETGSRMEQAAAKARKLLEQVIEEHPGTPWTMLAQRELKIPIGWRWHQSYTAPPRPREPNQNNNVNMNPERRPMTNRQPKQRRPIPRL